jgi:hypothetical protein
MSYEIVKKIRIEDNKVFITSESNNVYPKYFKEWECTTLSTILQEEGEEQLNFELLKDYENGNMQEGNPNKWSRAINRLKETEEYSKFNWRKSNYADDNCPIQLARNSEEYRKFILSSLNLKDDIIGKFRLKNTNYGNDVYVLRVTKRLVKFTSDITKSKVFKKKSEIDSLTNMFPHLQAVAI